MMRPTVSTAILLAELRADRVAPERYSRQSGCGRWEQLALTTVAACVAVLGPMVLHAVTKPV